jgi:hypothetical protein
MVEEWSKGYLGAPSLIRVLLNQATAATRCTIPTYQACQTNDTESDPRNHEEWWPYQYAEELCNGGRLYNVPERTVR